MLNPLDLKNRPLFEGIQGNILKAHGRHHTANLFVRCHDGKQNAAKVWLRSLVENDEAIVQSGYQQLRSNILYKQNDGKVDTGLFACVHISAAGYDYLFGEGARTLFSDAPFRKGMQHADEDLELNDIKLGDPPVGEWEEGFQAENHFMLLLAHAKPDQLSSSLEDIRNSIDDFGQITTIEIGDALFNKEKAGIEHFGYVDGVSQPLFFEDEWEVYKSTNNIKELTDIKFDPRAEKELVLVPDPFGISFDPNALGSYFVFRKLEQNVKGFKQAENELANSLGLQDDKERAGGMLVGRFEDGTPIEMSSNEGIINSALWNNFDYEVTDGSKCPFHGHIRKTNPRSNTPFGGIEQAKTHIMARRGIPFGTRTDDPNDDEIDNKPEGGVGLLFMSYQASIVNQFEFIQRNWANNASFPHIQSQETDGLDQIIGQGSTNTKGAYAKEWGNPLTLERRGFDQFVHMKGGEYFFAPSMSFLKNVDRL